MKDNTIKKVKLELQRFKDLTRQIAEENRGFLCDPEWSFCIGAKPDSARQAKPFLLTIMGIVHGNEVAGLQIVNECLALYHLQALTVPGPICMILGNPDAALQNKRFLESDLNRSFMRSTVETAEHRRAQELEALLSKTEFLLDLHQTRETSERPFFIFPYSADSLRFAHEVSADTAIVTHWGKPFSKDGRCTDEFVNTQGGCGITLELGQNSFNEFSVGAGVVACLRAMAAADRLSRAEDRSAQAPIDHLYTFERIVEFPQMGKAKLSDGWYNFKYVTKGDMIGEVDAKAIVATEDGRILFPYYPKDTDARTPSELCRLLKKITVEDLPKST